MVVATTQFTFILVWLVTRPLSRCGGSILRSLVCRKMKVLTILQAPEMRALEGGQLILHDYGRSPLSRAVEALS